MISFVSRKCDYTFTSLPSTKPVICCVRSFDFYVQCIPFLLVFYVNFLVVPEEGPEGPKALVLLANYIL